MPHFIIDCSADVLSRATPETLLKCVYQAATATGLFAPSGAGGIKVRINPYQHYLTVGTKDSFIHVFAHIMEGRTQEEKKKLSTAIVTSLSEMRPDIQIISVNISDFERATYCNKAMIDLE